MTEVEATAYHEAGHVIAIRHVGRRALSVSVTTKDGGYAQPDKIPDDECDVALVGLAGIQAESQHSDSDLNLDAVIKAYVAAASDRNQIAKAFDTVWLAHNDLWHKSKYDKAHKFVQEHEKDIRLIAEALLKIDRFPKTLYETQITALLST